MDGNVTPHVHQLTLLFLCETSPLNIFND